MPEPTTDRYRVGTHRSRNIYDAHDVDDDGITPGRWLATAGDAADAARIVAALNIADDLIGGALRTLTDG
jgi:hypothetical protein